MSGPVCRFCGRPRKPRVRCFVCFPPVNTTIVVAPKNKPSRVFTDKEMTR